jgi:hypothetical protein
MADLHYVKGIHFTASPVTGSSHEEVTTFGEGLFFCDPRYDAESVLRDALGTEGWRIQEILEQKQTEFSILRQNFPHLASDLEASGHAFEIRARPKS